MGVHVRVRVRVRVRVNECMCVSCACRGVCVCVCVCVCVRAVLPNKTPAVTGAHQGTFVCGRYMYGLEVLESIGA